jgi:hypothetical protein
MDAEEPLNLQHFGIGGPFWDQRIKRHKMAMILFYVSDYFFVGRDFVCVCLFVFCVCHHQLGQGKFNLAFGTH